MSKVILKDIVYHIEITPKDGKFYLNKETGEIVFLSREEISILNLSRRAHAESNSGLYSPLPERDDLNEFKMMQRFCVSVIDETVQSELIDNLLKNRSISKFKEDIKKFGLQDEWNEFKEGEIREIAIHWCRKNNFDYEN